MYGRRSEDSAQRPLSNVDYSQAYQGDSQGQYGASGYGQGRSATPKKSRKPLYIGLGVLAVLLVAGAVVGGVLGSRAARNSSASAASSGESGAGGTGTPTTGGTGGGSGTVSGGNTAGSANGALRPTGTDANGNPLYPTSTGSASITAPRFVSNAALSCGADPYAFPSPPSLVVRPDHPRLFAPAYKWACLPKLIAADSYMANWNATIFRNASRMADMPPVAYTPDGGLGGSGVLDNAREIQVRLKHWGYAWKLSNDTRWVDRAWLEIQVAAGNSSTQPFGATGDNWNSAHFLDVAEFTQAFAIAYDWMYDAWTPTQRTAIMWSIITLGLNFGTRAYRDNSFWIAVNGNWNCVCNNGLTAGALAIAGDDPTGVAASILRLTVPNAALNCANGPDNDGTWSETANYWYFGTTAHVQMAAQLLTATGSTQNLLTSNPGMEKSGNYHMYVTGMQGLFAYGDTGPNKFSATANGMMFYGSQYNNPVYTLFQRDRGDAPEPMSMLYYDPQVSGQFWLNMPLDAHFANTSGAWGAMRSSWTNTNGIYVAMKSSGLQGHQTHGNLDAGTFVLDALGQRFAGELGNGNYLATGYFSSEGQVSDRWLYYRERTEGQNTLLQNGLNQNVLGIPTTSFGTSGDAQGALNYTPAQSSTAYLTTDMTPMYNATSINRGIRLINGRKQVLLQDEIVGSATPIQWRMHTNATVVISNAGKTATLTLATKVLIAQLLSPASASFTQQPPVRLSTSPPTPPGAASQDQPNTGTVLTIAIPAGRATIQVLFNPQADGMAASAFVTPPNVPLSGWTVTSHN